MKNIFCRLIDNLISDYIF